MIYKIITKHSNEETAKRGLYSIGPETLGKKPGLNSFPKYVGPVVYQKVTTKKAHLPGHIR